MAIDSIEKRKSVASLFAALPVAIEPDNTKPQGWRQNSGWGYYGILSTVVSTPPPDDDADTTVTTRVDHDGTTIRPPRVTLLHAMDSLLNADLVGPHRIKLDSFEAKSDRMARGRTNGRSGRIFAYTNRAADGLAIKQIIVTYTVDGDEPMRSEVT